MKPDKKMINQHLIKAFGRCEAEAPGTIIQMDRGEVTGPGWGYAFFQPNAEGLQHATQWAMDWNTAGWNLYAAPNPRKGETNTETAARNEDVAGAFNNFADLDSAESLAIAKAGMPLNNTWSVTTGTAPHKRVHLYWEHDMFTQNMTAWVDVQQGVRSYFRGDAVIDPRRIMRLAGTVNYPSAKKIERGYKPEMVVLTLNPGGEERDPVSPVALHTTYAAPGGVKASETGPSDGKLGLPGLVSGADVTALMEAISEGNEWHNNICRLTAHWVAREWSDAEIIISCRALTLPGYTTADTDAEVMKAIKGARDKWGYVNPVHEIKPITPLLMSVDSEPLTIEPMSKAGDVVDIPKRQFIYGLHLIAGFVAVTISPGGVGKTTLMMIEAVAIASGKPLLGINVDPKGQRVLHINLEDPLDELHRRYYAILDHFDLDHDRVGPNIFLHSGRDRKVILAETDRASGTVVATDDGVQLKALISALQIAVVQIDPMVKCHYVDENSNKDIDDLMTIAGGIAHDTGCAIDFAQHVRKSAAGFAVATGDINQARGASALAGAVRTARTLTQMTVAEAEGFGIPEEQHNWYVRVDDAKNNMSPPAQNAAWHKRHSVIINNSDIGDGDSVGVLAPWAPPEPFDDLTDLSIGIILHGIDKGPGDGHRYSATSRGSSKRWVGTAIKDIITSHNIKAGEMTDNRLKRIIKAWQKSGLFINETIEFGKTVEDGVKVDWTQRNIIT